MARAACRLQLDVICPVLIDVLAQEAFLLEILRVEATHYLIVGYLFRKEGNEPISYLFVGRPETNPVAVSIASFRGEILLLGDYSSAIVHDSRAHNQRLFIFGEVDRPELHWL